MAKDTAGHTSSARGQTTVAEAPGGGAGEAIVHYQRTDGYDGWGLHLWGDAIAASTATQWTSPRLPSSFDDYGAVFTIPLVDAAASLNFITHKGDDKDGGDRAFVPEVSREVWLKQGDPRVYTSRPSG